VKFLWKQDIVKSRDVLKTRFGF